VWSLDGTRTYPGAGSQRSAVEVVSNNKITKKINAKSIMTDLKDGLSDSQLMEKYGLSFQGLQELFSKLVHAKLATRAYFDRRAVQQVVGHGKQAEGTTCPYCGYTSDSKFERCPRCQQDTSEWLDTVELTKILTGSFD
jgi:lipopolysaccharide biosynthesis regulator YciM